MLVQPNLAYYYSTRALVFSASWAAAVAAWWLIHMLNGNGPVKG